MKKIIISFACAVFVMTGNAADVKERSDLEKELLAGGFTTGKTVKEQAVRRAKLAQQAIIKRQEDRERKAVNSQVNN